MENAYRLLDVGGTFVKRADGSQIPIASDGSREAIAAALKQAVRPLEGIRGVGICVPGPFNYREGRFLMQHKFASVYGELFRELAEVPEQVELRFGHDVNVPLGGACRQLGLTEGNTALVTLGTGLGFAYAVRGEVQCTESGSPVRDLWNQPFGEGILEDVISSRGIRNAYRALTGDSTQSVLGIAQKAFSGEEAALEAFSDTGQRLGEALAGILAELDVDTLLMGGQISKSLSLMIRPLQNALDGIRISPLPDGSVFAGLRALFQ